MDSLQDLYCLAEQNGIQVDNFKMKKAASISLLDQTDQSCFIAIDNDKILSQADEHIKLAHELGHCMTGSFYNEYAEFDIWEKHESRADEWALEHLIPLKELRQAMFYGYTDLQSLADYFNVSLWYMHKALQWYTINNSDEEQMG